MASISVPVQANVPGVAGNVGAGTISLLASGISGVDTVTNPVAFATGIDAETDDAARARFGQFIASLAKATAQAVGAAVAGVQSGLLYQVVRNSPRGGTITVYVDDGSGAPSAALLAR